MLKRELIDYLEQFQNQHPGCFFADLKVKYLYLRQLQELYDKIQNGDLVADEPNEHVEDKEVEPEPEPENKDESESESDNEPVDDVLDQADTNDVFSSYSKGEDEVKEDPPKPVEEKKEDPKVEEVKVDEKKGKKTKVKSEPLKTKKDVDVEKPQKTDKGETTNNISSVRKEIKSLLKEASADSSKLLRMMKVKKKKYGLDENDEDLIVEYYNELRSDLESEINSLLDTLNREPTTSLIEWVDNLLAKDRSKYESLLSD
jgi:hypothetical protein